MRARKPRTPNGLPLELDRSLCPFPIPASDRKKGILTMDDYDVIDVFGDLQASHGIEEHSIRTIVTDNPWQLKDHNMNGFEQVKKYRLHPRYPTLSLPRLWLMNAGINRLAAPKSHLWAWTIKDMLPHTFALYESWGWQYKQCYTYVKTYGEEYDSEAFEGTEADPLPEPAPVCGGGFWGRNSCEYLLFFVNTSVDNRPLNATKERNVIYAPVPDRQHSAKPPIAFEVIRRNSPGPRVSLFERSLRDGFVVVWGNEAPDAPPEIPRNGLISPQGALEE